MNYLKKSKKTALVGYILPFACTVLMLILFLLPIVYFKDYTGEFTKKSSVFSRMADNFSFARQVLFSNNAELAEVYGSFARSVLGAVIVVSLCFAVGFTVSFIYMIIGLKKVNDPSYNGSLKKLFVATIPNRALLFVLFALTAVPSVFPRILAGLIERRLIVFARTAYTIGDPIIYCLVLCLIPIIFFALSKRYDIAELNIFKIRSTDDEKYI